MAMISPVIELQQGMRSAPNNNFGGGVPGPAELGVHIDEDGIDVKVPRVVGALVIGSALVLLALRMTGFRFSFGASIGGSA